MKYHFKCLSGSEPNTTAVHNRWPEHCNKIAAAVMRTKTLIQHLCVVSANANNRTCIYFLKKYQALEQLLVNMYTYIYVLMSIKYPVTVFKNARRRPGDYILLLKNKSKQNTHTKKKIRHLLYIYILFY